ncbi:MAG: hypothetical protein HC855_13110 [Rhizobiales bacterium]|nr:hypothetical protein [Hyphomicrobiales bacterium]
MRGDWISEVGPTKEMLVTDCPCEDYTQMIEITCKPKSGTVHVELHDFLGKEGKDGDAVEVEFAIDGKTTRHAAILSNFSDGELQPVFDTTPNDDLFAAIAGGKRLVMTYQGRKAETALRGSSKAIAAMGAYCAEP